MNPPLLGPADLNRLQQLLDALDDDNADFIQAEIAHMGITLLEAHALIERFRSKRK